LAETLAPLLLGIENASATKYGRNERKRSCGLFGPVGSSPSAKVGLWAVSRLRLIHRLVRTLPVRLLIHDDFAKVAVTLWAICFARRRILHEDEYQSPLSTHLFIERYLKDLVIASPSIQSEVKKKVNRNPIWIPPS
jgi:hypothetical protein